MQGLETDLQEARSALPESRTVAAVDLDLDQQQQPVGSSEVPDVAAQQSDSLQASTSALLSQLTASYTALESSVSTAARAAAQVGLFG